MPRTPDSRLRIEGFRKAEASLRLEGKDPSGTPLYKSVKARIILGELTYEQGRPEILAYYTKADTAGTVTVGEILTEEFLKALNMSHDELAEAMGFVGRMLKISSAVYVVLGTMRPAFLLTYLGLMRIFGAICRCCMIAQSNGLSNQRGAGHTDWIEKCLAHEQKSERAVYNKVEYREQCAVMLQDWADMIDEWNAGARHHSYLGGISPEAFEQASS